MVWRALKNVYVRTVEKYSPCILSLRIPCPCFLFVPPQLHWKYLTITPVSGWTLSPVILEKEQSSISSVWPFHCSESEIENWIWAWIHRKILIVNRKGYGSLRKQSTFCDATTGFPAKWRLRNERRNSILMTRYYPDLGSTIQPIRSTTHIWVVTRHPYGMSALVS